MMVVVVTVGHSPFLLLSWGSVESSLEPVVHSLADCARRGNGLMCRISDVYSVNRYSLAK